MGTTRTTGLATILMFTALAAVGCQTTGHQAAAKTTKKASLLFVQTAESGTLTPLDAADGSFRLRLVDPSPQVVYFTDRPARRSGVVATDEFLAGWRGSDSFADDPPNAALLTNAGGAALVFELEDPVRMSDGAVEYTATMVGGSERFRVQASSAHASDAPRNLGRLALFIDNLADANSFGQSFAFNQTDPENQRDNAGLPGSTSLNRGWPAD